MRREIARSGIAALLLAGLVALASLAAIGLPWPGAVLAQPEPTATPIPTEAPKSSACSLRTGKVAGPSQVELGDTVQITLTVRPDCPETRAPMHLMLLLDGSSSMAGNPSRQMKDAAQKMVDRFNLVANPSIRIGVVEINLPSRLLCPPTSVPAAVKACISLVGSSGGTDLGGAIELGRQALTAARADFGHPIGLLEAMIIVTDGSNNDGCLPVLTQARDAKREGIIMINACVGGACDAMCLRSAASAPRYFYQAGDPMGLIAVLERIRKDVLLLAMRQVSITDSLPDNMGYVPDSAMPPADIAPDGKRLTWTFDFFQRDGVTMTFKVRPTEPGLHPTNRGAFVAGVDLLGALAGPVSFPVPTVQVLGALGAPSPTPTEAVPTGSASLGLDNPRPRRGERSRVSYSLRFDPPELPARTHVTLVADASGSMSGESNNRLKAGLKALVNRLAAADPAGWKAALISFNGTARGLCGLTSDVTALERCISLVGAEGGTSIDSGMDMGLQALRDGRPSPGHEDMVVFTDGSNNNGCSPVLSAAAAAKAEGVELHMVCLQTGACDATCMRQAASSPDHYHEAGEAAALPAAFGTIADRLVGDRRVAGGELRLELPPSLRLVAGSASLPPYEASDHAARWSLGVLPLGPETLNFAVEAIEEVPSTLQMTAAMQFLRHPPAQVSAKAEILPPDGAPTTVPAPSVPTPPPSGTVPVASPTAGGTSTPDSSPRPTATSKLPLPFPYDELTIYLPLAVSEACPADSLDLALALDSSSSMAERAAGGGTKIEAAVAAVEALVEGLRSPGDRIALVSFNRTAQILVPLTGDRAALRTALSSLALGDGTAIDQGLARSREALANSDRRAGSRRLILLLTDGRATTPAADAISQAAEAKAAGIAVYAVGLGGEVDARTLAAIASSPVHYRAALGRVEVAVAFGAIARRERCAGAYWAER